MRRMPLGILGAVASLMVPRPGFAGTFVPVPQFPGSSGTAAYSINTADVLTGTYTDQSGRAHGFVGTLDGQYVSFDYGKDTDTQGRYINDSGIVTGIAFQRQSPWLELQFVRNPDGTTTRLTLNGKRKKSVGSPGGLTDDGQLAGQYQVQHKDGGFGKPQSYTGTGTDYSNRIVLPFKKVYGTYATGVNNNGDIVGYYEPCGVCTVYGFVIRNGAATQVEYPDPNEQATELLAINDDGLATGQWTDIYGATYAFLFDIPNKRFEPLEVSRVYDISNGGLVAVLLNDGPYIYCLSDQNCPQSPAGRIHVKDTWMLASPGSIHSVPCKKDCLRGQY